jgi:hypothetical protein
MKEARVERLRACCPHQAVYQAVANKKLKVDLSLDAYKRAAHFLQLSVVPENMPCRDTAVIDCQIADYTNPHPFVVRPSIAILEAWFYRLIPGRNQLFYFTVVD